MPRLDAQALAESWLADAAVDVVHSSESEFSDLEERGRGLSAQEAAPAFPDRSEAGASHAPLLDPGSVCADADLASSSMFFVQGVERRRGRPSGSRAEQRLKAEACREVQASQRQRGHPCVESKPASARPKQQQPRTSKEASLIDAKWEEDRKVVELLFAKVTMGKGSIAKIAGCSMYSVQKALHLAAQTVLEEWIKSFEDLIRNLQEDHASGRMRCILFVRSRMYDETPQGLSVRVIKDGFDNRANEKHAKVFAPFLQWGMLLQYRGEPHESLSASASAAPIGMTTLPGGYIRLLSANMPVQLFCFNKQTARVLLRTTERYAFFKADVEAAIETVFDRVLELAGADSYAANVRAELEYAYAHAHVGKDAAPRPEFGADPRPAVAAAVEGKRAHVSHAYNRCLAHRIETTKMRLYKIDSSFESGMVHLGLYWKSDWNDFSKRLYDLLGDIDIVDGPLSAGAIEFRDTRA